MAIKGVFVLGGYFFGCGDEDQYKAGSDSITFEVLDDGKEGRRRAGSCREAVG